MSYCRTCRSEIMWVTMAATGKKNPLNARPDVERGNVWRAPDDTWVVLTGLDLSTVRDRGEDLFLSHFATCPNSKQHRKSE